MYWKNCKALPTVSLLEQFTAEHDMALLQNCPELQLCVVKCVCVCVFLKLVDQPRPFIYHQIKEMIGGDVGEKNDRTIFLKMIG